MYLSVLIYFVFHTESYLSAVFLFISYFILKRIFLLFFLLNFVFHTKNVSRMFLLFHTNSDLSRIYFRISY